MSAKVSLVHNNTVEKAASPEAAQVPYLEVADLLVAYLEQLGIEYVFGVPGGAIEPIYNALARSQRRGGTRPMVARHEAGAAFMADGYARETGKIGVCCATSGPGATNLITGVATAYDNGVPMLVLTSQPPLPAVRTGVAIWVRSCGSMASRLLRLEPLKPVFSNVAEMLTLAPVHYVVHS